MTVIFSCLRWRNFLSTGAQFTEVRLDKSPTTLVLGENGSGKSTMLDALCYGLFKRAFRGSSQRVNKAQLVNAINNGDCEIEIEFSIGTHEYRVRRGIKPDFFELYVDGEKRKSEAAKKDDQAFLEEDILKVNYETFKQVVILGNADYTPFMQLKAADRRKFIEHILDIGVFSSMNQVLKDRQAVLKTALEGTTRDAATIAEQVSLVTDFIRRLEDEAKKDREELEGKIDQANQQIEATTAEIETLNAEIARLSTLIEDEVAVGEVLSKLSNLVFQGRNKIQEAKRTILFYAETDICSTCKQVIDETHRKTITSETEALIERGNAALERLVQQIDAKRSRQEEIGGVSRKIQKIAAQVQERTSTIRAVRGYINKLRADLKKEPGNIQEQQERLALLHTKWESLERERQNHIEERHFHTMAGALLQDDGIKAAIIKHHMPEINRLVNRYLTELDFFVSFHLTEGFEETFKSRNRDKLSYFNFSQGEKLRIDLALLFAWRDVARGKNSCSTNLLILDEVIDSSHDHNGTDHFIRMLQRLSHASNVFVISHKNDAALDKFHNVLRFARESNFSRVEANI